MIAEATFKFCTGKPCLERKPASVPLLVVIARERREHCEQKNRDE